MTVDQQTQVPTTTQLSVRRNALTGRYRYYRVPDAPLNSKLAHLQQNFSIVEPSQVPPPMRLKSSGAPPSMIRSLRLSRPTRPHIDWIFISIR